MISMDHETWHDVRLVFDENLDTTDREYDDDDDGVEN